MDTITEFLTLKCLTCADCGIAFAMPAQYMKDRREDHEQFCCPNGHKNYYAGKSEAEKLRDQLAREQHNREQANARLLDLESTMSRELRAATQEAKAYRHSPAQRSAFWRGYESRGCALPSDCPYETNRGGFRHAWFAGAALDFPHTGD